MSVIIDVNEFDDYSVQEVLYRYQSHFSVVYLYVIDNIENNSIGNDWIDSFLLWKYLDHLEQCEIYNKYPDKSFSECVVSKWPFAGHYGDFSQIEGNPFIYSETNSYSSNGVNYQNLFSRIQAIKVIDGIEQAGVTIIASSPTDIFRLMGINGIEIHIDPTTNKIIFSGSGIIGGDPVFDTELLDEVVMPEDHGGYSAGTTVGDVRGVLLKKMLEVILFPAVFEGYIQPLAQLFGSNPKLFQVGNAYDITLTGVFTQNDAGPINSYELKKDIDSNVISTDMIYIDLGVVKTGLGTVEYWATFGYDEGPIKNDSAGTPQPNHILANSKTSFPVEYKWIYPYFWGISTTPGSIDIAAGNSILQEIGSSITINFNSPNELNFLWFAVPSGTPVFTDYYVAADNLGLIGSPSDLFDAASVVLVSKDNFSNVNYDLYVSNFGTAINDPMQLNN